MSQFSNGVFSLCLRPAFDILMKVRATALLTLALFAITTPLHAATITVDSAADSEIAGDGACTLREAINNANGDIEGTSGDCTGGSGPDVIEFAIGGGGAQTVILASVLPRIDSMITIDGTTQGGFAGTPLITLDGPSPLGVRAGGAGSTLKALAIRNAGNGTAAFINGADNTTFENIDMSDPTACVFGASGVGLSVLNASNVNITGVDTSNRGLGMNISDGDNISVTNSSVAGAGCSQFGSGMSIRNVTNLQVSSMDFTGATRTALSLRDIDGLTIDNVVPAASTHYVVIEPTSGMTAHDASALGLNNVNNSSISNVDLSRPGPCVFDGSSGLSVINSSDLTVDNVNTAHRGGGISFNTGDNISVTNSSVAGAGCAQFGSALSIDDITNVQVSNIDFTGATRTALNLRDLSGLIIDNVVPAASTNYVVIEDDSGTTAHNTTALALTNVNNSSISNVDLSRTGPCVFDGSGGLAVNDSSDLTVDNVNTAHRGRGINISNGDNISVTNSSVAGAGCAQFGSALAIRAITNLRVSNIDFTGATRTALSLTDLTGLTIDNVVPATSTNYVVIEDDSGMTTHNTTALGLSNVNNSSISNVDLSRPGPCVFDGSSGLAVNGSADLTVDNVNAANRGGGMFFNNSNNISVTNSSVAGAGCAQFGSALSFNNVTNIQASGTDFTNAQRVALNLQNITGLTVDNTIPGGSTHYVVIEPTSGMTTHDAIALFLTSVQNSSISNVDLSRTGPCVFDGSQGIRTASSSNLTITAVDVSHRGSGLLFSDSDHVIVTDNNVSGAGCAQFGSALSFNNVTNIQASGTDFTDAQRAALVLQSVAGVTISDTVPAASTHYVVIEPDSGIGATAGTGIALNQADDIVIENVALLRDSFATLAGISAFASDNLTVTNVALRNWSAALILNAVDTASVSCTAFITNSIGASVAGSTTGVQLLDNHFQGNTTGVRNVAAASVDAENNFWGTADGSSTDTGSGDPHSGTVDALPFRTSSQACTAVDLDYGDAPAPYPTIFNDDGARHDGDGTALRMGATFDNDPEGQPNPGNASGDDTLDSGDDEDGLTISSPVTRGQAASFSVAVTDDGTAGQLNAWVDYNRNGSWDDAGEQVATDVAVTPVIGSQSVALNFAVPAGASPGISYARIRLDSGGGLTPTGLAEDGEVEDAQIIIYALPGFSKSFAPATILGGQVSTLTFTIDSSVNVVTVGNLSFSDSLPTSVVVAATPNASTTCTGGTLTATASSNSISYTGGSVSAGGTCTVSVDVTSTTTGSHLNTSDNLTSDAGTSSTASDTLVVFVLPSFSKAFSPSIIAQGATSTLTFTIDSSANSAPLGSLAFTDNLPAGVTVAATPNATATCTGGTITANAGASSISYNGGSVAASSTCTISVDVTSSTPGSHVNTSGNLTSEAGTSSNATDTLIVYDLPGFAKVFSPDVIAQGDTSTLTFTIDNSANATSVGNLDFTDNLPSGVTVAATPNASNSCTGGTLTANAGASSISYSGGSATASSSCSISVDVTSSTPGSHVNTTGDLTSDAGNSGTATDTLIVYDLPGFAKVFNPDVIAQGDTSTLTFTIDNTTNSVAVANLDFTDNLPTGVTVASTPNASNSCTGGTLTVNAGASSISYTGGTVTASSTCVISVDVTSATAASHVNTTGDLTSDAGNSGTASDTLIVLGLPGFAKVFNPDVIVPGDTSTLTFTIDNTSNAAAVGSLAFIDNLPASITVAATPAISNSCTGGTLTANAGASSISYTGGSVAASSTCAISVDVTSSTPGSYTNTTGDLTSEAGNSGTAADTLIVYALPGFSKAFAPDVMAQGDTSTLTLTIDNTANATSVGNLDFTDNLPAGVTVAATPAISNSCTGGTLTANPGGTAVSYTGGSAAASSSCSISVNVTSSTPGSHVNTTGDLTSDAGNSGTASDTLIVLDLPGFSKAFAPDVIAGSDTSTLTFTIDNTANAAAVSSLDFTDNLPTGVVVDSPPNAGTTCTGGTLTATAGTSTITYSGGSVTATSTCTVSVDVTSSTPGDHLNTTGDLTSIAGNSGTASDTLTVLAPPTFTKVFAPDVIAVGGVSTLTLTIDSTANSAAVANLDFTDNLPANVTVAATPNASTTCSGGTLTAVAGSSSIAYSGGSVAATGSCTVTVDVTSSTPGSHVNTTGNLTSDAGNSGTASDTLTVVVPPGFSKAFAPATIEAGQVTTLTFTIDSTANTGTVDNLAFSDLLPPALIIATPASSNSTCSGTVTAPAGGNTINFVTGTVGAAATCTVSVNITTIDTSAAVVGPHINTSGDLTSVAGSSGSASATLNVLLAGFDTFLTGTNLSFESFVVADGAFDTTLPGWTASGAFTFNPDTSAFPNEATDGDNTAGVNAGSIEQITSHTLQAGTQYAIVVDVGDRLGLPFVGYTVELLADGTPFATTSTPSTPADGAFATAALIGTAGLGEDGKVLGIRLTSAGLQTNFDNVRLLEADGEPIVTITSPADNSTVAPGVGITFNATATDAEDGDIAANLTWNSSIDGNIGTGASFFTSSLSAGNHAIIASVSDSDANPGSASLALSIAVHAAPVVTITSPSTGDAFLTSANVNLAATANDAEDGDIAANLTWTSDVDGNLGAGASLTVSTLSLGAHTITASVDDSGGQNGQDTISLRILVLPGFSQAFSPTTIAAGDSTTLTFTIDSTANLALAGNLAFSDTLPNELVVATPPNASTTCGGTLTAPAGASTFSLNGGSVAAAATCSVSVDITTADTTAASTGQHLDTSGDLTSDAGNSGAASATLAVLLSGFDMFLSGNNLSFEDFALADGAFDVSLPSWTTSNAFSFDPAVADFPGEAPEGENTAAVNAGSVTQTLGTTLNEGASYALVVDIGDRLGFAFGGFTLELLADGVVFASSSNSVTPTDGNFATAALSAVASAAEDGKTLGVRLVSAGSQTHFDDVRLMSSNAPPMVAITSPNNNDTFLPGASVSFAGTATDAEDGTISANLAWTSSLDGSIGSGAAFSSTLSIGNHTITASVTDSGGSTVSDNLQVVISANSPPVVTITTPTDGASVTSGASVSFSATATDAEEGDLSGSLIWTSDRDGNIGSGAAFSISDLSTGVHNITASVTDSNSAAGSDTVQLTLVFNNLLTNPGFEADCPAADLGFNSLATGWTKGSDSGTFNPTTTQFSSEAPEGQCTAYSSGGTLSQVTSQLATADTTYTLAVRVGDRADTPFPGFSIEIWIDGVLRASADETDVSPANGEFANVSTQVVTTAGDAGKTLEVRLVADGFQINFDDVRLTAEAAPGVPGFSKAFSATTIELGAITTLTFTIDNSANGIPVGGLAFSDTLPAQLVVAPTPAALSSCGGTVTAVAASGTISFSGGSVGASTTCTVQVDVTTVDTNATTTGLHTNVSGSLTTAVGTAPAASADLAVVLSSFTALLNLANASFEDQVVSDGNFDFAVPSWTSTGTTVTFNPSTSEFPGEAPDGDNTAALNSGSLTQASATLLVDGTTYAVVVEIGDRADLSLASYTLELLADGVAFASVTTPLVPAVDGTFEAATLTGAAGASEDGKTLGVRLTSGGVQVNFDNVRLMSD